MCFSQGSKVVEESILGQDNEEGTGTCDIERLGYVKE